MLRLPDWPPEHMPKEYHFLPREFRKMPRTPPTTAEPEGLPEPPDFALLSKSISDDTSFCSNLYSFSNTASYESLLLPRVPSPSLRLEEMLGLWPSTPKSPSAFGLGGLTIDDCSGCRDSVATIVHFGDWISDQSQSRSPSLLPPAPLFNHREPSVPKASMECRLPPTLDARFGPRQVNQLCSQLEKASFLSDSPSFPATRTTTPVPVPSLTHSHYSTYSLPGQMNGAAASATVSLTSPTLPSSLEPGTKMAIAKTATIEPNNNALGHSSPEPTQGETSGRVSADIAFAGESMHNNPRSVEMQLPQLAASPPEVSYIEWDDDDGRRGPSRMARVKKSLADLRAAERFIADVGSAKRTATSSHKQDVAALKYSTVEDSISSPKPEVYRQPTSKDKHDALKYATCPASFKDRPLPEVPIQVQPTQPGDIVNVDAASTSKVKKGSGEKRTLAKYTAHSPCLPFPKSGRRRTISAELDGPLPASPMNIYLASEVHAQPPMAIPFPTMRKRKRISGVSFKSGRSEKKRKPRFGVVGKLVRAVLRFKQEC